MKVGKAGKACSHAAYIVREGKYANRLEQGEKLEATEAGNMPTWAQSNPSIFWQSADVYERKNGTTYREMEIALPRELNPSQRATLVREFVHQEIGDRHAYQWVIHTPTAVDGKEQPHVHLMFSERQRDNIERDPEQYFKRYNAKTPERGGARKGYGPSAGQTLTKAERIVELKELRGRWETLCNTYLEKVGVEQRIDMRSHADRGTGIEPERKQLPSQWQRGQGRAKVIEFRQARAELAEAQAEVINLDTERQRRDRDKAKQVEAMPSADLVEKWNVERDKLAKSYHKKARNLTSRLDAEIDRIKTQAGPQPQAPQGVFASFKRAGYEKALETWTAAQSRARTLRKRVERIASYSPDRGSYDKAQKKAEKTMKRIQPQWAARIQSAREEVQRQEMAKREWEAVPKEFANMAFRREVKANGWSDKGDQWQAAPEGLRKLIDRYNAKAKETRTVILESILSDTSRHELIRGLMTKQRENYQENSRGLSR